MEHAATVVQQDWRHYHGFLPWRAVFRAMSVEWKRHVLHPRTRHGIDVQTRTTPPKFQRPDDMPPFDDTPAGEAAAEGWDEGAEIHLKPHGAHKKHVLGTVAEGTAVDGLRGDDGGRWVVCNRRAVDGKLAVKLRNTRCVHACCTLAVRFLFWVALSLRIRAVNLTCGVRARA